MTLRPSGIHQAESEDERRAVYRFRYDVYVAEMGKYRQIADHENRLLIEPEDAQSRIFYAAENGEVVGTARITWGGDAPIPARMIEQYQLEPFLTELPPEAIAVGERGMVSPRLRGTDLFLRMIRGTMRFTNDLRIQLFFGDCEPHLLSMYLAMGHRTYSHKNVNSAEGGYLIPLMFVCEDAAYLRRIGSPLADAVTDYGDDARIPACVDRIAAEGTAVISRNLTPQDSYWGEVYGALSELEEHRISALDGLSDAQAERCLARSNIIECAAGDRVLKKGGTARNIFVVLEGTLEARDGDRLMTVMGPGEVFGEVAFLLEQPRSLDVYAATDARVLSLSEGLLRKMIESDPDVAAGLLLNISKMLCFRLLKSG